MSATSLPHWKLRRFAARALTILARHADSEPVLSAFEMTLGVSAPRWIEVYDRARASRGSSHVDLSKRDAAVLVLHKKMRGWAAILAADIDSIRPVEFGDRPGVVEDVVSDAEQLVGHVDSWEERNGVPLPYSDKMRDDLRAAIATAKVQSVDAGDAAASRSAITRELRDAAARLHKDLKAFRRSLATHLGRTHADYQKLRARRVMTKDKDDGEIDDTAPSEAEADAQAEEAANSETHALGQAHAHAQ